MADEQTTNSNDEQQGTTSTAEGINLRVEPEQPELGDAGKKAIDAERRNARAATKERDALAARLKEYEDRDKTEADKMADRLAAAEQRATAAETARLRQQVALDKGLPAELVGRLRGDTEAELEADADDLLAVFNVAKKRAPGVPAGARGGDLPVANVGPGKDRLMAAFASADERNK